jgi:hypothetical protein
MVDPGLEQLLTAAQFRARTRGRFGVIVIDDKARDQPIAHDRECSFITEDSFVEKVLEMGGRQGRYFWAKNSRVAAEQLGARLSAPRRPTHRRLVALLATFDRKWH